MMFSRPKITSLMRGERDFRPAEADVRAHHIAVAVEPLAFALALAVEELEALDGSHALDEGGVLLGLSLDRGLGALPEHTVESEPNAGIERQRRRARRGPAACCRRKSSRA